MAILSLYWGVLYNVEQNLRSLVVHVVDFDGQIAPYNGVQPIVGPAVTNLTEQLFSSPEVSLGYTTLSPSQYNNDPLQVREAVYRWDAWAAIVVNPNATALLQEAVATGNASYDPSGSVQIIFQTARDSTTVTSYLSPYLQAFVKEFTASFGPMWGQMVISNDTLTRDNLASASSAVNPGVTPLMYDLRPFQPPTSTPTVSIGLIYLIIMAFFSFSFFMPIHMVSPQRAHKAGELRTNSWPEIYSTTRTPSPALLATDHLAMVRHCSSLHADQPRVLSRLPRLPDPLHRAAGEPRLLPAARRRDGLRPRDLRGVLARQLRRDVRARPRLRERRHDRRAAVGGALAHLLGHHQRVNLLLQHRPGPRVLPVGVRVAPAPGRRGEPAAALRPALADRPERRGPARVGGCQHGAVPLLLLLHAVEGGAGEEAGRKGQGPLRRRDGRRGERIQQKAGGQASPS